MPYKDKNKQREYERLWKQKEQLMIREKVSEMFNNRCAKCGYCENILAFQIDHIKPLLRKNKEDFGGDQTWRKLYRGKITKDNLQMLCANCHVIKTLTVDIKTFGKAQILRSGEKVISPLS